MDHRKNKELAIAATSKIYEKINNAEGKEDTDIRWPWELIQNAKDSVVRSNNINGKDNRVNPSFIFGLNEENKLILRFEHDGGPFRSANDDYKYDDPKCLLLGDSGKIEEDESTRVNVTGQFGSGFMSTHILSKVVEVKGEYIDSNNDRYDFNFTINRSYNHKKDLVHNVERSLNEYDDSFINKSSNANSMTVFTYNLFTNTRDIKETETIIKTGFRSINRYIGKVLLFSKELATIGVKNNFEDETLTVFRCEDDDINSLDDFMSKSILSSYFTIKKDHLRNIITDKIRSYFYVYQADNVILAIDVIYKDNSYHVTNLQKGDAALYCTFPLIGSEDFYFPCAINSNEFHPSTEREGINLAEGKDNGNRELFSKAMSAYLNLCDNLIKLDLNSLHRLAAFDNGRLPDWCAPKWCQDEINKLRRELLTRNLVLINDGTRIQLKESYVIGPLKNKECENEYYKLVKKIYPKQLCVHKDTDDWVSYLDCNFEDWKQLILTLTDICEEVGKFESLC
jgi:hypothetical protein